MGKKNRDKFGLCQRLGEGLQSSWSQAIKMPVRL